MCQRAIRTCLLLGAVLGGALLFAGCVTPEKISPEPNSPIVLRYFNAWANTGDTNAADALIATNVVLRHPHIVVEGRETYKQGIIAFRVAFPDLNFAVEEQVEQGNRVLARWVMTGTQRGEFMGHPPSGKAIRVTGMSLFRIENGRIQEIWASMDRFGLMEQLGIASLAAPPASPDSFPK